MKISEIKKAIGGKGTLVWLEPNLFTGEDGKESFDLIFHTNDEMEYDSLCMYPFESVIDCKKTRSQIAKAISEAFSVDSVYAYQRHACGTEHVDKDRFIKLGDNDTHEFYDANCSYIVAVKKPDSFVPGTYNGIFIG